MIGIDGERERVREIHAISDDDVQKCYPKITGITDSSPIGIFERNRVIPNFLSQLISCIQKIDFLASK